MVACVPGISVQKAFNSTFLLQKRDSDRMITVSLCSWYPWRYVSRGLPGGQHALRMHRNVNVGPVLRRGQTLVVEHNALDILLDQANTVSLIERHPGYIIDQLLLRLVVIRHTDRWVLLDISLFQQLLRRYLRGRIVAEVLAIVPVVIGSTLVELQGGPVLRIGVVGDPAQPPHLQTLVQTLLWS